MMLDSLPFRYPDKPIDTTPDALGTINPVLWCANLKYDGWRMPIFIDGANTVRLLTSHGRPMASRVKLPHGIEDRILRLGLPDGTVLDSEFVGPRGQLKPTVYIFDCLAFDGTWLQSTPYVERWQHCMRLSYMFDEATPIRLATTLTGGEMTGTDQSEIDRLLSKMPSRSFMDLFNAVKAEWYEGGKTKKWLYEGIVVKRLGGTLRLDLNSNKKSQHMVKLRFREIGEQRF